MFVDLFLNMLSLTGSVILLGFICCIAMCIGIVLKVGFDVMFDKVPKKDKKEVED